MAFSQLDIADVQVLANGPDLFVTWTAPALAPRSTFQVYLDRQLVWSGSARRCHLPTPSGALGRNVWVEVGTVGPDEPTRDYSASLTAPGGRTERATLTWSGGTYLDPTGRDDVGAFQIYQSLSPGEPVDETRPVASVVAYPGGWINDGFGKGGFGAAGFGRAATFYEWQSGPLAAGAWRFAIVAVDRAGNPRGDGLTTAVTINAAPLPPAPSLEGNRLAATYSGPEDRRVTLQWLPSPIP